MNVEVNDIPRLAEAEDQVRRVLAFLDGEHLQRVLVPLLPALLGGQRHLAIPEVQEHAKVAHRRFALQVLGGDQFIEIVPDRFLRRIAEQVRELAVDAHHLLVRTLDRHGFRRMLEQLLEVRLLQQQLLLCQFSFVNVNTNAHHCRLALVLDRRPGEVHPALLPIPDPDLDLEAWGQTLSLAAGDQATSHQRLHLGAYEI